MYDGDVIRLLLAKQKKSQRDLSLAVTGKPNSSLHHLYKNPTASTIEKVADFFNVTIDSLFVRTRQPIDYATETDMENGYLKSGNKYLVDNNFVDAIIQLPANMFFGVGISTCIMILRKNKTDNSILFIDASKKFDKGKKQNEMTDVHINEVMKLYSKRETVEKESFLASFEKIEKNDFNLNIPRYVDNFEKEEEIDLNDLLSEMKKTDDELEKTQGEFLSLLRDLTSTDDAIMKSLDELIAKMEG